MSRLQLPSQLLRATLRASTPLAPLQRFCLNLAPPSSLARAFSQTCHRLAEEGGSSSNNGSPQGTSGSASPPPASSPSPSPSPLPSPSPPSESPPLRQQPQRVVGSIFAPTPMAAQPDSAGFQTPAPPASTPPPSGPSPLPRTSSWHAAQADRTTTSMPDLARMTPGMTGMSALFKSAAVTSSNRFSGDPDKQSLFARDEHREPFHLHIFAHRHNTHITLTRPSRDPIISISCGNLGFKKSKRKHYDAAYQLMQHVLQLIEKKMLLEHIYGLEVVMRGFGQGREAAAKVLLSSEGAEIKKKIVRVSDATRIKFGGTRSPNPRRV